MLIKFVPGTRIAAGNDCGEAEHGPPRAQKTSSITHKTTRSSCKFVSGHENFVLTPNKVITVPASFSTPVMSPEKPRKILSKSQEPDTIPSTNEGFGKLDLKVTDEIKPSRKSKPVTKAHNATVKSEISTKLPFVSESLELTRFHSYSGRRQSSPSGEFRNRQPSALNPAISILESRPRRRSTVNSAEHQEPSYEEFEKNYVLYKQRSAAVELSSVKGLIDAEISNAVKDIENSIQEKTASLRGGGVRSYEVRLPILPAESEDGDGDDEDSVSKMALSAADLLSHSQSRVELLKFYYMVQDPYKLFSSEPAPIHGNTPNDRAVRHWRLASTKILKILKIYRRPLKFNRFNSNKTRQLLVDRGQALINAHKYLGITMHNQTYKDLHAHVFGSFRDVFKPTLMDKARAVDEGMLQAMERFPSFSRINARAKETLIANMELVSFSEHSLVFVQGQPVRHFHLILNGQVELFSVHKNANSEPLMTTYGLLQSGDSFGEFEIFANSPSRLSSVSTTTLTLLARFPATIWDTCMKDLEETLDQTVEHLKRMSVFDMLGSDILNELLYFTLARFCEAVNFVSPNIIETEGKDCQNIYFGKYGSTYVMKSDKMCVEDTQDVNKVADCLLRKRLHHAQPKIVQEYHLQITNYNPSFLVLQKCLRWLN